jgi:hypothetical protein
VDDSIIKRELNVKYGKTYQSKQDKLGREEFYAKNFLTYFPNFSIRFCTLDRS